MFQFTPLLGAQSSSSASQSLLELDGGVKVLIDVGWDHDFDVAKLKSLERHVSSLSVILLTHATPSHLAAFAHCCKHFPLFTQVPIYATSPVISLGRTLLQDIYSSTPLASTIIPRASLEHASFSYQSQKAIDESFQALLQPPTSEEIASYFALINPLKYSQPHQPLASPFSPPLNDLTVTAYNAGHTLGGTIWHIQHGMESVVYAVDWNQVRENVLAGAAWLGGSGGGAEVIEQLRKPTALVCSAKGAEKITIAGGRKRRDDLLLDMIRTTMERGGTVLIPTDTSARVLELAYVLEHAWRREASDPNSTSSLKSAILCLASKNSGVTMRYARSMLEWMDENVVREFESESVNSSNRQHKRVDSKQGSNQADAQRNSQGQETASSPFEFRHLKMLENRKRIDKLISHKGPKVILASDISLEWGFSKDILRRIAEDPVNLIILTAESSARNQDGGGLSSTLWRWYLERRDGVAMEAATDGANLEQVHGGGRVLKIEDAQRLPLEGKELLIYQHYLATRRQSQNLSQSSSSAHLESSADAIDEASSSSSSSSEESDPERQGKALNTSAKTARFNRNKIQPSKEMLGVNILIRQPGVYDFNVQGKKGRDQMFPFVNKRRRADDFGDVIRPEDYLRAEERDEVRNQDMRDSGPGKQGSIGQKRKWQDSVSHSENDRQIINGSNNRSQHQASSDLAMLDGNDNSMMNGHAQLPEDDLHEDSDNEQAAAVPSKVTFSTASVEVNLKIAYVDYAGLHDQRSLSMLIPLVQPKKLILVGGDISETSFLANDCKQKLRPEGLDEIDKNTCYVFTPSVGQMVDASVDTNAWTVKMSEALTRRLHWQDVRGLGVVTLMGYLGLTTLQGTEAEASSRKKLKTLNDVADEPDEAKPADTSALPQTAPEYVPTLDLLPTNLAVATRSVSQSLHVGDLRLADLKKILQSTGHAAEFKGEGTLLIDGFVAVRKSGIGKLEVESGSPYLSDLRTRNLESSFYAVKRKIYEGLAVISGG